MDLSSLQYLGNIGPTLLVIVGGVVLIWQNYSLRKASGSGEVISTLQVQVQQLKDANKLQFDAFTSQIGQLTLEIGKLKGSLEEKENTINRQQAILENRNPELLVLLGEIKRFMDNLDRRMTIVDVRTLSAEKRNEVIDSGHAAVVENLKETKV